ncbi:hypothetical protein GCM10010390_73280 [Streptomyces mordarskii]|uniref:Uncharacterized protein n=1 Tax=Streptomyces mordarskii TaxID=1226758 RepID=A0ABP3P553_9ACTN
MHGREVQQGRDAKRFARGEEEARIAPELRVFADVVVPDLAGGWQPGIGLAGIAGEAGSHRTCRSCR